MRHLFFVLAFLLGFLFQGYSSVYALRYNFYQSKELPKNQLFVRVKLYAGKAKAVYTKGSFVFTKYNAQVLRSKKKFVPNSSGYLESRDNTFKLNGKTYQGKLRIIRTEKAFVYINYVPLNKYLISVVGHEMSASWPIPALKAQAILARTYLLKRLSPQKSYDVVSSTSHQMYGGTLKNDSPVRAAVSQTKNKVLTYHYKLAQVFYHANSGGQTAASAEVWKSKLPYLKSKESPYAEESPSYRWRYDIPLSTFARKLGVKKIDHIEVTKRSDSQRAVTLVYNSNKGKRSISANNFRKLLGTTKVKSTLFDVRIRNNQLQVGGKGYGHGVGMGQWDAKIMAEKYGFNYRSILYYFFPGTKVKNVRLKPKKLKEAKNTT